MSKILYFATFTAGACIGAAVAWHYAKNKYEQLTQEEIDSVKEVFSRKGRVVNIEAEDANSRMLANDAREKPDISEYASKLSEEGYTSYSDAGKTKEEDETEVDSGPYVIAPEEFGENPEYEKISLTYFADKIVADDDYEMVDNVDEVIGLESLKHFGDYEDDSVFVRNDKRKCDYEILMDYRKYMEILQTKPYLRKGSEE